MRIARKHFKAGSLLRGYQETKEFLALGKAK